MAFAPDNANYVLTAPDVALTNYHILNGGKGISFTAGAAQGNSSIDAIGKLALLADLATTGYMVIDSGPGNQIYTRTFVASSSVSVTNGNGVAGATSFAVIPDTTIQRVGIQIEGDVLGSNATLNLIGSGGVGVTGQVDNVNNRINLFFTGGGSGDSAPADATYWVVEANEALPNAISTLEVADGDAGLLRIEDTGLLTPVLFPETDNTYLSYDTETGNLVWTLFPSIPSNALTYVTTDDETGTLENSSYLVDTSTVIRIFDGATLGFYVVDSSTLQNIRVFDNVTSIGEGSQLAFDDTATVTWSGSQVSQINRMEATVVPSSTVQLINVQDGGTPVLSSSTLNFTDTATVTAAVTNVGGVATVALTGAPRALTTSQYLTATNETPSLPNSFYVVETATILPTFSSSQAIFTVKDNSSIQKINVQDAGSTILQSSTLNFVDTGSVTATVTNVGGVATVALTASGGSGTVTSVGLSSPNSNAILSGTNPITSSGTINIDVGLPIKYDPLNFNLSAGPNTTLGGTDNISLQSVNLAFAMGGSYNTFINTNYTSNSGNYNTIVGGANLSGFSTPSGITSFGAQIGANVDDANHVGDSVLVGSAVLGGTTGLNITTLVSQTVIMGAYSGWEIGGNLTNSIILGFGSANNITSGMTDSVVIGTNSLQIGDQFSNSIAIGSAAATAGTIGATSTFDNCIFLGTSTGGANGSYSYVTLLGANSTNSNPTTCHDSTAVGANTIIEDQYQVVLGKQCSLLIDEFNGTAVTPATPSGNKVAVYTDNANNKLLRTLAADAQKTGAIVLANSGVTVGVETLSAGVNPVSSVINTTAIHSGTNCVVFLTVQTPTAVADVINFAVGSINDGTSFRIYGNGTLTNNTNVAWMIVNTQ